MNIFISYSSQNRPAVEALVADLENLGHAVWYDQELAGGQVWWDSILEALRGCDLFVFALTNRSLQSDPCRREYTYAHALDKPILPVQLTDDITISLLPVVLQERNIVNYINQDKPALLRLVEAITRVPPAPPLPDPLPEPPAIPISPLARLQTEIMQPSLTYDEQVTLFHQLKGYTDNPDLRADALKLLEQLEKHPSLLAAVFKDINAFLSTVTPRRGPEPVPPPPAPASQPPGAEVPTGQALVTIFRENAWNYKLRAFQIHINGQHAGEVRNNSEASIALPAPGRYALQMKVDFLSSDPVEFDAAPDQTIRFTCRHQLGLIGKLIVERTG
jgi:hypothetical protein